MLDNIQNEFLRNLLDTPRACPTPSLMWETGTSMMTNRIIKKKLIFYHHLTHLSEDSLAWQVGQIQLKLDLPGLLQECKEMERELSLPDSLKCTKNQWKNIVNKKVREKNKNDLIEMIRIKEYKKLDANLLKNENFEAKSYMKNLSIQNARTKFAIRTKMVRTVKLNYKNDPSNKRTMWECNDCYSIDSQEHILWCPAYQEFRVNKDLDSDKDLTRYFQQVLIYRDE